MSTALKCPNPSCPYLFDPSRVPPGAVLTCPRCGMRFTLGPPAPNVTAPPQSQIPAPPKPPAEFEGMAPNAPEIGPDGQPVRRSFSAAGEAGPVQTVIISFICFVMLAGVSAMIYFRVTSNPNPVRGGSGLQLSNHNLSFEMPGEPWALDDDTRAKLGPPMILAFKRTEPDAFFCVGARDYETREPRASELRSTAYTILDRTFEDVEKTQLESMNFLGQPATVAFSFRAATKDGARVAGLCYATGSKGIGYWAISWAGEADAGPQAETFEAIRAKLKLNNSREDWQAKQPPVRTFGGHAVAYRLLDGESDWAEPDAKVRSATDEDPKGDLLLQARLKVPGKDFAEEATLVTILLDSAGGDPLAQGRKYVEDRMTAQVKMADEKLEPTFIERNVPPEGDPPSGNVETPAPVVRLQMTVKGASNYSKLIVVSAAKIGDRVVVVFASCSWPDRELFEGKLMQIAGSLRESQ